MCCVVRNCGYLSVDFLKWRLNEKNEVVKIYCDCSFRHVVFSDNDIRLKLQTPFPGVTGDCPDYLDLVIFCGHGGVGRVSLRYFLR